MRILLKLGLLASGIAAGSIAAPGQSPHAAMTDALPASGDGAAAEAPVSISARCEGGLVPTRRTVTVFSDGRITVLAANRLRTGAIAPGEVRALSARLAAAGFDSITAQPTPRAAHADVRDCVLQRVSGGTTHGVRVAQQTPAALANILRDILSLAARAPHAGAGQ